MTERGERISELARRWGAFADAIDVGKYEYLSQITFLNQVEAPHLQALQANAPAARRKVLLPAVHELTHWLDHVSTLWGRARLVESYKALAAREANDPREFERIVGAFDEVRRIRDQDYYTVEGRAAKLPRLSTPWVWELTCGSRFDSSGKLSVALPIVFVRFHREPPPSDEQLVVRVPLSPLALTEANALAAERQWVMQEAAPGKTTAIELAQWESSISGALYDPAFAVYTAAIHCVANHTDVFNLHVAFEYTRPLATLCLNFPWACYSELTIPMDMAAAWSRALPALVTRRDPGFVFLLLCRHRSAGDS